MSRKRSRSALDSDDDSDYEPTGRVRQSPSPAHVHGHTDVDNPDWRCVCGFQGKNKLSYSAHRVKCRIYKARQISGGDTTSATYQQALEEMAIKRQRRVPPAYQIYKKENINPDQQLSANRRRALEEQLKAQWNGDENLQRTYDKYNNILQRELKEMEPIELEMERYNELRPEECTINESNWSYTGNPEKFIDARMAQFNGGWQFIRNVRRFGEDAEERRAKFWELLSEWKIRNPLLRHLPPPTVCGTPVDLYIVYCQIVMHNGYAKAVKKSAVWKTIGSILKLHGTPDTLYYQLRVIYFQHLFEFERYYQIVETNQTEFVEDPWLIVHDNETISQFEVENPEFETLTRPAKRRKIMKKSVTAAKHMSQIVTNPYITRKFNDYWGGRDNIGAILLSLQSGQTNDINWALNRLLYLSYQTGKNDEPLVMRHYSETLLNALCALLPFASVDTIESFDINGTNAKYSKYIQKRYHSTVAPFLGEHIETYFFGDEKSIDKKPLYNIRQSKNDILDPSLTRVVLRILSNLSLTADNQLSMIKHNYLLPYLVELTFRRDFVPSDCNFKNPNSTFDDIHLDALRIVSQLSSRINLIQWVDPKSKVSKDFKHRFRSPIFVNRLLTIIEKGASMPIVGDVMETRVWMVRYSLDTFIALIANPNNREILSSKICFDSNSNESETDPDLVFKHKLGQSTSSSASSSQNSDEKSNRQSDDIKIQILDSIVSLTMSNEASVRLRAIQSIIYLCEAISNATLPLLQQYCDDLLPALVDTITDRKWHSQLHRSASYCMALLNKNCGDSRELKQKFARFQNHVFEGSAQMDNVACYGVSLCRLY